MESVVSDAIVVLERQDVLWAEVMFSATEIRALEDPYRERRGHQLSRVLSTTHWLAHLVSEAETRFSPKP